MGRQRRRNKSLLMEQNKTDTDSVEGCENCRLAQKKNHQHNRAALRRQQSLISEAKQKDILKYLSDCESEADSAIDTASVSSSSDNHSLVSDHHISSDSDLISNDGDACCSTIAIRAPAKVANVSIAAFEAEEAKLDIEALAEYVTGVPLQKYTARDTCVECVDSYRRALHQHQHDHMRVCGIDDSFSIDLTGLDVELHVEEFSNWTVGTETVQTKEHGYYVSPKGATYYTDIPMDAQLLSLPKQLMVPPSERAMFDATHPPQRPWIPLSHPERNKPTALFTVMCYNVLCDKYCTRQLYGYSPSWALHWDYRKKGILEEIRHYNADVVSLQEVETEQFYQFFAPEFEKDGYQGIFAPKSRAKTMQECDAKHVDGCAIFWKTSKFKLITKHVIEFNQLAIANAEGSENILNRVMTKDNIGLCALLETKEDIWDNGLPAPELVKQPVLISTAHVIWDPEFCDVKLVQSLMLMSELKNFVEKSQISFRPGAGKSDCSSMPMILCGDLNSLPDSGVVEFLSNSKVSVGHLDFKDIDYEQVLNSFSHTNTNDYLNHAFSLKNAYDESIMEYTNYTYDFKGVIDYVFFSDNHMNPLGVLGPLEKNWFTENKVVGCPHPHIPSDHFSLLVEFELPASRSTPSNRR